MKINDAILTEIEQATREALRETAKEVLKVAEELVPVDSSRLRKSGKVRVDDMQVRVTFSGPHAWLQHEKTEYQHPGGGQAKYLEAAVDQVGVDRMVADQVRTRVR